MGFQACHLKTTKTTSSKDIAGQSQHIVGVDLLLGSPESFSPSACRSTKAFNMLNDSVLLSCRQYFNCEIISNVAPIWTKKTWCRLVMNLVIAV